ncbi:MAG: hypothetical protein QNK84_02315 [Flavobacteriales bacterium]
MKKLILGCFLASLLFACNPIEKTEVKRVVKTIKLVSSNAPNKDSELALLMRKMYLDADSIKQLIVNNTATISDGFIAELETVKKRSQKWRRINL